MTRRTYTFRPKDKILELGTRTRIIGVVNVTPDSFSDGARFLDRSFAVEHCLRLVEQGSHILELGGESTRPGAEPVPAEEEMNRVLPVLQEVRKRMRVPISVDTYKAVVAREALKAGADMINDISAFRFDPEMPRVARDSEAGVVLMHMRGIPKTMQQLPPSPDIILEVQKDLQMAVNVAYEHQIRRDRMILDPGIGFGKTVEDNLKIINRLSFLDEAFQLPVLVGTSRKSFLGKILDLPPDRRLMGTAASVVVAILRGAHIVRVHDVAEIVQVVKVTDSLLAEYILP